MSKGSTPTNITTTTEAEPSEFIRPYLTTAIDDAEALYRSDTPQFFPEATFVDFAPETETALDLARARATSGNPLLGSAQTEINKILSGDYLSPTTNPFAKALFDQMAGDVTSQVQSQFSRAGRLGSGANQEILTRSLGELANRVYGDQFDRERDRQFQATQIAPALGRADFDDIQALAGVGAEREALEMAKLQDAVARFDFEQQKPYMKLNQFLGALGANVPTSTATTQPVFRNVGAGLLGGALTGAELAGMVPGINPMVGAIGGGLLGAIG